MKYISTGLTLTTLLLTTLFFNTLFFSTNLSADCVQEYQTKITQTEQSLYTTFYTPKTAMWACGAVVFAALQTITLSLIPDGRESLSTHPATWVAVEGGISTIIPLMASIAEGGRRLLNIPANNKIAKLNRIKSLLENSSQAWAEAAPPRQPTALIVGHNIEALTAEIQDELLSEDPKVLEDKLGVYARKIRAITPKQVSMILNAASRSDRYCPKNKDTHEVTLYSIEQIKDDLKKILMGGQDNAPIGEGDKDGIIIDPSEVSATMV